MASLKDENRSNYARDASVDLKLEIVVISTSGSSRRSTGWTTKTARFS
jgi:hypothetical protein